MKAKPDQGLFDCKHGRVVITEVERMNGRPMILVSAPEHDVIIVDSRPVMKLP